MPNFINKCKSVFCENKFLSKADFIIMGVLTLIFTVLVFFKIGNIKAPQTYLYTTAESRDVIIDFGDYITVEQLHVYLGALDNRKLSLSAFNEVTGEWEIINSEVNVGSVFQWNNVDIYYTLRYLGIVATDDEAYFNEFVFTGPDGVIEPINTASYPDLFDEQDLFYDTKDATYMDGTMFDEVYHGRTGYEFVHGLPTYETTHPQLGKCFIALGIKMFGMTPFGMRFFSAIFGIMFVPLMYMFAKRLFDNTFISLCVGTFITFDCMHYTLSRIATIDIFVAFFIILSYYYMYRYIEEDTIYRNNNAWKKDPFPPKHLYKLLILCGIFMGCAISTKMTGVYAAVGLAVLFICHTIKYWPGKQAKKMFGFCVLFFIVCPIIIYTLAYIPAVEKYAQMGSTDRSVHWDDQYGMMIGYGYTGLIARTLRNTNYMINYHKNLEATHYYSSPFYQWPIMWKPLLAAFSTVNDNEYVSAVSYMGNPIIWWAAIPCVFYTIYKAFKKDKKAIFLTVAYFAQYLPWMLVSRITFIYHYLPCIPFSMFMMGYTIKELLSKKPETIKSVKILLGLSVLCFILFFPVISGVPAPKEWGLHLRLLPEWILVL